MNRGVQFLEEHSEHNATDIVTDEEMLKAKKYEQLVRPYDELLADLAVALYFSAPNAPAKGLHKKIRLENGVIWTWLICSSDGDLKIRSFDQKCSESSFGVYSNHGFFAPIRSQIWSLYQSMGYSPARFLKAVVDAAILEIRDRIKKSDLVNFNVSVEGKRLLLSGDVSRINQQFLEQIYSQIKK